MLSFLMFRLFFVYLFFVFIVEFFYVIFSSSVPSLFCALGVFILKQHALFRGIAREPDCVAFDCRQGDISKLSAFASKSPATFVFREYIKCV